MIDISRLSAAELDRFLYLQSKIDRQTETHEALKQLRDYYYGNHPVMLTQRQHEFLGAIVKDATFKFSHNLVRTIVDTLRERLNVIGFTVNGKAAQSFDELRDRAKRRTKEPPEEISPEAQLAALMWSWWNGNRMDSEQIRCHRRTLRDGTTYAIVDFDAETGRPRINLHKADDGKSGVTYHRDPTNTQKVLYANRYWYDYNPLVEGKTGNERKTTYLPGEVRKYIRRMGGDWEPYSDPEDFGANGKAVWPLPWRDAQGMPLGAPVIEFANPGGSEIAQVIGLQNAVNKSWLDVIAAADSSGFPMVVVEYSTANGLRMPEAPKSDSNITGEDELEIGPGREYEVEDAAVHRLDAANLDPMLNVVWALVGAMAGVARVPQYTLRPLVASDVPSGEALKMLESGLVKRAQERQLIFGQSWGDVMHMCVKVARAFGDEDVPELDNMDIATVWGSAEVRNEKVDAETALLYKQLGMPDEYNWAKTGVEPDQIAAFKDNARAERAKEIASLAESLKVQSAASPARPQPQPQQFVNGNGNQ